MSGRAPLPEAVATPPRGRVLLVAPHPDDDIIGPGGTVALHAAQGDPVRVLVLCTGRAGDPEERYEATEHIALRRAEARAGGRHLGLFDYGFWDYPEGFELPPEALVEPARRLAREVRDHRVDIVYAPWIGEQHIDHHNACRITRLALASIGFTGQAWGYEVWTPLIAERIVDISDRYDAKVAALGEHRTQIEYFDVIHMALAVTAQRAIYLPSGARHGEAFAPLGPPDPADLAVLGGEGSDG